MRYFDLLMAELKHKLPLALITYPVFVVLFECAGRSYAKIEVIFVIFSMAACSYLFGGQDEIELLIISKASLKNIFGIRLLCIYVIFALPAVHLYFRCIDSTAQAIVAFLTTVLFCRMLGAFWRVMLHTPYAALIFSSVCFTLLLYPGLEGEARTAFRGVSPLYSMYLSEENAFLINRLLTLGYSVVLFFVCYIKLHKKEKV